MRAKLGAVSGDPSWRPARRSSAHTPASRRGSRSRAASAWPWRPRCRGAAGCTAATWTPDSSAARRRVRSYWSLDEPDVAGTVANWREWLNERGPILVKIAVDEALEEGSRDVLGAFDPGTVRDRHAAALVGYGPDHFILRSSWGTDWAADGYARLADGYAADAVEESYGVVIEAAGGRRGPRADAVVCGRRPSGHRVGEARGHPGSPSSRARWSTRRASHGRSGTGAPLRSQSPAARSSHAGARQSAASSIAASKWAAASAPRPAAAASSPAPRATGPHAAHGSSKHASRPRAGEQRQQLLGRRTRPAPATGSARIASATSQSGVRRIAAKPPPRQRRGCGARPRHPRGPTRPPRPSPPTPAGAGSGPRSRAAGQARPPAGASAASRARAAAPSPPAPDRP